MSFHWFAIAALHPEAAQQELNAFLADSRVLSVQRAFVPDGAALYWSPSFEVSEVPGSLLEAVRAARSAAGARATSDDTVFMTPREFALFTWPCGAMRHVA